MAVLMLGSSDDPHIKLIKDKIESRGKSYEFINIYQDFSSISYYFSKHSQSIRVKNQPISVFNAIYWRTFTQNNHPTEAFSIKILAEFQEMWNFFLPMDTCAEIKCINPLWVNMKMENKIFQLNLASKLGLEIPSTFIGSNHHAIIEYSYSLEGCIEKSLGMLWDEYDTPSKAKTVDILSLKARKTLPCIYQKHIERKKELRVYIVGHLVIAVEINLSAETNEIVDWKEAARKTVPDYLLCTLPNDIVDKLLEYHKAAELCYAAYDLIMDIHNKIYFLECNPNGNWNFLPEQIRNSIADAIVEELV